MLQDLEKEVVMLQAKLSNVDELDKERIRLVEVLDLLKGQLEEATKNRETNETKIIQLKHDLTKIEEAKKEVASLQQKSEEIWTHVNGWTILRRLLSKEILILKMEHIGQEVSQIANRLLINTFGSEYTIFFRTLELKKDGSGYKDVFDIVVLRGPDKVAMENLSKGEQVFLQQALMQAFGIYRRNYLGVDFGLLIADESDGALDMDNKKRYLDLHRTVHQECNLHFTFLVSHDPTIQTMLTQRLILTSPIREEEPGSIAYVI